jgi:GT2 family glycosyltransferase
VDDGSTDGTSLAIQSQYPEVIILTGDGNLWWTGAIKKGMEYAYQQGAEFFIWLNDDCIVSGETLKNLVAFCQKNSQTIIGCQGRDADEINQISFGGKIHTKYSNYQIINCPHGQVIECDLLSGNLVCFSRKLVADIGYPNPSLVPHYGGDSLYLIKARKAGFRIFVDNRIPIYNVSGDAKTAPQRWLLKKGAATDIIKLLFLPQSLLSWRVWLALNLEEYGQILGFLSFFISYSIQFFIPVILITLLRLLPMSLRYKVSAMKQKLVIQ